MSLPDEGYCRNASRVLNYILLFDIGTRMRKTYCQVDKITMRTAWNYKCSLYNKDIFIIDCLVIFVFIF